MSARNRLGLFCALAAGVTAIVCAQRKQHTTNHDSNVLSTRLPKDANRRARGNGRLTSIMPRAQHVARGEFVAPHIEAARGLNHGAGLLALSVLTDSAMEHYRGAFSNPAMWTPLFSATLALMSGVHGGQDRTPAQHTLRHGISLFAATAGLSGTAFHLYNVCKRPGGWSWDNLFHAAPLGAPMALLLSGALGTLAERLRDEPESLPRLCGAPAGLTLGLFISAGLIGTTAEAALLHFRGSFQHRAMYAPVIIPPLAAIVLAHSTLTPNRPHAIARLWMRITAVLGVLGSGFHIRGIARRQGGWRNWTQNLFAGPPIPAPPSFSALALAGLAALRLRETEK